ncbi:MAG: hypothetical protein HKP27_16160, partial [Myxococcales bacterium]|nr:hypothetical protein [Myxococcales bacterium]
MRWLLLAERLLDETVLGFFALASLFLIFVPSVFDLTQGGEEIQRTIE